MPKNPNSDQLSDIGELTSILRSTAFRRFLEERKAYLQGLVNRHVREQNLIEAFGALERYDDIDILFTRINQTIEELKKGGK